MDTSWLNEKIEYIPKHNFIYKIVCFFVGHKLTYQEMYMMLCQINKSKFGNKSKELSINKILNIYKKLHNNNLPKDF